MLRISRRELEVLSRKVLKQYLTLCEAPVDRIDPIDFTEKSYQEIEELSSEQQNLEVRMSLQLNLERIEDEALNRLGMVYPGEEQVRVIAIEQTNDNVVTANAAAEEGGQENIAP